MGKETKKTPPKAPQPKGEQKKTTVIEAKTIENLPKMAAEGMDKNRTADTLTNIRRYFFDDPDAAAHLGITPEGVQKINRIAALGSAALMLHEIVRGNSEWAASMKQAELAACLECGPILGFTFDQKLLPALNAEPDKIVDAAVVSKIIKISPEAEKAIKEEAAAAEKVVAKSPADIKSEEELKETLLHFLSEVKNGYEKFATVIPFYRAYLKIQAGDDKEKLEEINKQTDVDTLREITKLVGKCPFTLNGQGHFMLTQTRLYKSPVPAYCNFRNASRNRKTGVYAISDEECASYVRVLIEWVISTEIANLKASIEASKANIKVLSKDKKANEKAIEAENEKIQKKEETIKQYEGEVMNILNNPSADFVENIIKLKHEKDTNMLRAWGVIVNSYVDYNFKEVNQEDLDHNVQQWAGIITNYFRPISEQLSNYSVANIISPRPISKKKEEPAKEEKPQEEEPKK